MKTIGDFTGLYPLSKTLRFKLIPIGKTLEHIEEGHLLDEDRHRADSYTAVKKLIDEYHKEFIEKSLADFRLKEESQGKKDSLEEYFTYYQIPKKEESQAKAFTTIQENLRKQITERLTSEDAYKRIFKKELIQEDLVSFVTTSPKWRGSLDLVNEFKEFTTYFTGFHENRKNMYSAEEKSTAIAYRLIHENLPKFVDNMRAFEMLSGTEIADILPELYNNFKGYLKVSNIEDIFRLNYYSVVITQKQIEIYNAIIGGKSEEGDIKIKGLNEYINLYNQRHKTTRLPKLKLLFKQILSDRNSISWLPEEFTSDDETLQSIRECYEQLNENVLGERSLKLLLESLDEYDTAGIFIRNDLQLTNISQQLTGNWNTIPDAIREQIRNVMQCKRQESAEAYKERIEKRFKTYDSFSLRYINECLAAKTDVSFDVRNHFKKLGAVDSEKEQRENLFAHIANIYEEVKGVLSRPYPQDRNLCQDKDTIEMIKRLLDAIKELQHFIKPLLGKGDEPDKDERFYGEFTALWNILDQINPLYNKVRNYVTRKPFSIEKIKLNFDNSTLMDGWDLNKERDNTTVILRKDGCYFLGIMNKKYNKVFDDYPHDSPKGCYEKMEYKLLPGANKMLPKVFFSKSRIDEFNPSIELQEKYQKGTHKKGALFNLHDCHALIDFFKDSINKHEDWKNFGFKFSDTSSYVDISSFYKEVEQQGYRISFRNISSEYLDDLVEEGKLYLFQIYNKDFSPFSKGTPNMHTLYWKMLFDERNLKDVVYKLNGKAEIFFRKSSLKYDRPTHPAGIPIRNKNHNNRKAESIFNYDLIKNRRYTVDSFQFHVPVTLNFKAQGTTNINPLSIEYLNSCSDPHIIGIDRGERHLLYLSVIDIHGRIKEQFSLNEIVNEYKGQKYSTDYHDLLIQREAERKEARQSWQSIENIKELKEGYLSQVIHKIVQLMIKYNAIVVLEDLNTGFMRGRQKVERQVYQKFEKMLIDKLNYVVDKQKNPDEPGGLLNAYQFSNKFESFQKLGKQNGFMFYVPAWNTSKIDPVTGFVNLLDTRYENMEKSRSFFCKFDIIRYNPQKDWFEFTLDYDKFGQKAEGTRSLWTLCSHGTRIETFRNKEKNQQWDNVEFDLTARFKEFFASHDIDWKGNLKEAICNQHDKAFFEGLMYLLKLTLQMRNSITGTDTDYLISPVADKDGRFYDSRTCDSSLPTNADANGAYNIARKGLWLLMQFKANEGKGKIRLAISNKEWLNFAQEKPYMLK